MGLTSLAIRASGMAKLSLSILPLWEWSLYCSCSPDWAGLESKFMPGSALVTPEWSDSAMGWLRRVDALTGNGLYAGIQLLRTSCSTRGRYGRMPIRSH